MDLIQITPRVYYSLPVSAGDRPVMGAVIGRENTLVVEAGNSEAQAGQFLRALAQADAPPPDFVAITHAHWDHHFGSIAFDTPILATHETMGLIQEMTRMDWSDAAIAERVRQGLEIEFSLQNIQKELPDRSNLVLRAPTIGFGSTLTLDLGGLTAELTPVYGDHAHDSCVVWIPDERIVFLGDCIYPDIHHRPDRYTCVNLFPLLDRLLAFQADWYIPAHQPDPIPRAQFEGWAARLRQIGALVERPGADRQAVLAALPGGLDEDTIADVDAFLAGLTPA